MFDKFRKTSYVSFAAAAIGFVAAACPLVILPFIVSSNGHTSGAHIVVDAAISQTRDAHPLSAAANTDNSAKMLPRVRVAYDASVLRALKTMRLSLDHFGLWIDQHPGSAIAQIRYMPPAMQQRVASTALFIVKSNRKISPKTAWREASALVYYSYKHDVPPALLAALARVESTFDPDAVSSKGASGVMQVMWKFHKDFLNSKGIYAASASNPLSDPEKAIEAGCLVLTRYLKTYGSLQKAIARYYGANSESYNKKVHKNIANILNHHEKMTKEK
ncbi:hypothetical protein FACS1894167_05430 [Synergistales bacterium]|nr:hypothetical protein FACS1894167_05430 [Synergistales bacterium]GHV56176.1 hypothetical protein FACS1894216_19810 [Synergistales bacterium]